MIHEPFADPIAGPLIVRDAVARYLAMRVTEGLNPEADTYSHLNKHLAERLCAVIGETTLRSVKPDHLRAWFSALKNERTGRPLDVITRRHHLIAVKTFFKRCWREGWIERDPSLAVVLPAVEEKNVSVLPVQQAFEFFKANREHRAIGRIALEAFGGLRYTTAGKIVKADLKFDRRGIEMPSRKHKSSKRKFRQGQPPNCWAWLRHAPDECWSLTLRQYREEKKEMLVIARLRPLVLKTDADRARARELKNTWRHSFASYLLAQVKDFSPVAYAMQHARASTTEIYEGIADEFESLLYFGITPETVLLSWEDYFALVKTKHPIPPCP